MGWGYSRTRFFVHFIVVAVLASLLPVAMATPAAAQASLTVSQWQVDPDTGQVTYDITVSGTCSTNQCAWDLSAYYVNGSSERSQRWFGQRVIYASATYPQPYHNRMSGNELLPEITELRLSYSVDGSPWSVIQTAQVSPPYPDGTIGITANQWAADIDSGKVTYDLDVAYKGAGQVNGPCDGDCYWQVDAAHRDGSTTHNVTALGSGTPGWDRKWKHSVKLAQSDRALPEVTHVRAYLRPSGSNTGRDTYDSGWIQVAAPYPDGFVDLAINTWERSPSSGLVSYDLDVTARGVGSTNAPCATACVWEVQGYGTDGTTRGLTGGIIYNGTWSVDLRAHEENRNFWEISALRVQLSPSVDSLPVGRDTYVSPWYPVSDFMVQEIDVDPLLGFVAGKTLNELCLDVEHKARVELRIPDATPATSPHSVTEACLAASSVPTALKAIAAAIGGSAVIGALIYHYMGDDPNADSISKVAALPEAAGSGIRPPTSCLSDAEKASRLQELRDKGWIQNHHIATRYGKWKELFLSKLAEYDYATGQSLDGVWNLIKGMEHRGTHPPAYHFWVYRNLEKALRESTNWQEFEAKFTEWVRDVIRDDPTIVRWEWWRCP